MIYRHARSAVIPPMPGRLMTLEEQPVWINENTWSTKTMAATVMGVIPTSSSSGFADSMEVDVDYTGGRKRKEVVYDDGMTDAQFSRAMEAKGICVGICLYLVSKNEYLTIYWILSMTSPSR